MNDTDGTPMQLPHWSGVAELLDAGERELLNAFSDVFQLLPQERRSMYEQRMRYLALHPHSSVRSLAPGIAKSLIRDIAREATNMVLDKKTRVVKSAQVG